MLTNLKIIILRDLMEEAWNNVVANDGHTELLAMPDEQIIYDMCGKDADLERFVEQNGEADTVEWMTKLMPQIARGGPIIPLPRVVRHG